MTRTGYSGIQSLRAYQKCINAKDLSLQDCINICQAEDAVRMQVLECRPESVKSIQSALTAVPVHRLQNGSRHSSNSNRNKNKTAHNCYYCGAQNWTRELQKYARLRTILVVGLAREDTLNHCAEVPGHPYT